MKVVKYDLQDAVGTIQLCAGQDAGCEAAVHAMEQIFADNNTEAMILVDASNAFNCLNRQVTLLNCESICPALTHILTYPEKGLEPRLVTLLSHARPRISACARGERRVWSNGPIYVPNADPCWNVRKGARMQSTAKIRIK